MVDEIGAECVDFEFLRCWCSSRISIRSCAPLSKFLKMNTFCSGLNLRPRIDKEKQQITQSKDIDDTAVLYWWIEAFFKESSWQRAIRRWSWQSNRALRGLGKGSVA